MPGCTRQNTARAEAERANRVKSEFLATMSHELRTPLNAILGYSDLLLSGVPDPIQGRVQKKVERIDLSARHLLALIEEILTFSRLEAGEERIEVHPFSMQTLLGDVEVLIEPLATAKGIALRMPALAEPMLMRSDPRKIRQVLVNLLGNGIKFTRAGQVALDVVQAGEDVVFRVVDTGPGIAPEDLARIWEPFWQADGGSTRAAGGTGLGLSVSRRLARLLGGDLSAESEVGRGSTFVLRLPMRAPLVDGTKS